MTKYPKKNLQQEVEHKNYCFIWACFYQKYVHIYWEQWKFLQRVEGVLLLIKNIVKCYRFLTYDYCAIFLHTICIFT